MRANPQKTIGMKNVLAVAEVLGRSAVVVQDLKFRRQKDYTFTWDRVLHHEGDTGPFLQYTHARLRSLLAVNGFADGFQATMPVDASLLPEEAAFDIAASILSYHQVLEASLESLEPSVPSLACFVFSVC